MINNIHITLNSLSNASRILKETSTLVDAKLVSKVFIIGLYDENFTERENIDQNRLIWRVPLKSRFWGNSIFFKLIKYFEFSYKVLVFAKRNKIKLVNIHSIAILPLGVLIKWICRAQLVYDTHELETETYGLTKTKKTAAKIIERILIKKVALVIVVGDGINEWYRKKYGLNNIITLLNCPRYFSTENSQKLREALNIPDNKKIILYQGNLLKARNIEKLLDVFASFDNGKHVLVIMGYGELEPIVQDYVGKYGNIYFHKAVPHELVLKYTSSADIGIHMIKNDCLNHYYCMPNKLFEYIMAGIPVIVNDVYEMKKLVTENEIGIVVPDLTIDFLQNALTELDKVDHKQMLEKLHKIAKEYSWEKQESRMITAYNQYVFLNFNHS